MLFRSFASGAYQVEARRYGFLESRRLFDRNHSVLEQESFSPDEFLRLSAQTDGSGAATSFEYDSANQVAKQIAPPLASGGSPRVQKFGYDALQRLIRTEDPDGGVALREYTPAGDLKSASGVRVNPVEYEYDAQGRLVRQWTFQDYAQRSGAAKTEWRYDPLNGRLIGKADDSGAASSLVYEIGRAHV